MYRYYKTIKLDGDSNNYTKFLENTLTTQMLQNSDL